MSVSSCDPFDAHVLSVMRAFGPVTPQPTCPDIGTDGELVSRFQMCVHGLYFGLGYSLNLVGIPADDTVIHVSLCFQKISVEPELGRSISSIEVDRLAGFEQAEAVNKDLELREFTQATLAHMFKLAAGVDSRFTLNGEVWGLMQSGGFEGGVSAVAYEDGIAKVVVSNLRRFGIFVKVIVSVDMAGMYDLRAESLGHMFCMRASHMTPLLAAAREMVGMHLVLLRYPPAVLPPAVYPDNQTCPLLDALRESGFVGGRCVANDPSVWEIVNALYYGAAVQVHFRPMVSASLFVNGLTVECVFLQDASLQDAIDDFVHLAAETVKHEVRAIMAQFE